jgi:hypothetical protein
LVWGSPASCTFLPPAWRSRPYTIGQSTPATPAPIVGVVTAPYIPGPDDQPTIELAPPPPHRKTNTLKVALISLIGGLALCLGSLVMFAATVATPDKTTPARAADTATAAASPRPVAVLPTTTPTPPQAAHTGTRRPHTTSTARRAIPRPHRTTTRPRPKPTTTKPAGRRGVHPGAFCTPEGAIGYTTAGTRMRCTAKAGEDQARWRRA